jgi:hypothetical protein
MRFNLLHPALLLRIEGLAVMALAVMLYAELGESWLQFVLLFLVPDVALLAYLAGPRFGAAVYNALHTYLLPVALFGAGFVFERTPALSLALIWVAHIGFDRVVGYGLKYAEGFKHTHLQRSR